MSSCQEKDQRKRQSKDKNGQFSAVDTLDPALFELAGAAINGAIDAISAGATQVGKLADHSVSAAADLTTSAFSTGGEIASSAFSTGGSIAGSAAEAAGTALDACGDVAEACFDAAGDVLGSL